MKYLQSLFVMIVLSFLLVAGTVLGMAAGGNVTAMAVLK